MSRIGKKIISIPKETKVEVKSGSIYVEGPKGKLTKPIHGRISVDIKDNILSVKRLSDSKLDKALQGLTRAFIFNMVKGVMEGYTKELEIQGVGFKAQVQGNVLNMNLGFSHPVVFNIPEGIKIEAPKLTQVIIRGVDKEKVGEMAAEIRAVYPPEPYKGKGVRYKGEFVKKKVGKAQATGGK